MLITEDMFVLQRWNWKLSRIAWGLVAKSSNSFNNTLQVIIMITEQLHSATEYHGLHTSVIDLQAEWREK